VIKPHGADALNPLFVADQTQRDALLSEAENLSQVLVSSATAANAVMLGGGYFTPLNGYMTKADALSVAKSMTTASGVFFPVPVLNLLEKADFNIGQKIALLDPNVEGNPVVAVQTVSGVEQFSEQELNDIAEAVYGTNDRSHPGVDAFLAQGSYAVAGEVQVLNFSYFETDFADTFRTAVQIRDDIAATGWEKVVAFQTRNPMHRAHEELCRMAMEAVNAEGCVIHMLLGKLKAGDIPADVFLLMFVTLLFAQWSIIISLRTASWLPVMVLTCCMLARVKRYCTPCSVKTWAQRILSLVEIMLEWVIITARLMHKLFSTLMCQKVRWRSKYLTPIKKIE